MKVGIQVENINLMTSVLNSQCNSIRFGSEFCEIKLPSLKSLKEAYKNTLDSGKEFVFITPRVTNQGLKKIEELVLNLEQGTRIVINDLGILNMLLNYDFNLEIGRQLTFFPASCPWENSTFISYAKKHHLEILDILKESSLNHTEYINFFLTYGISHFDLDLIPDCIEVIKNVYNKKYIISLYVGNILVAVTRKCHTARLFGQNGYECSNVPCVESLYELNQKNMDLKLFLYGNTIFRREKIPNHIFENLSTKNIKEVITHAGILSGYKYTDQIDDFIKFTRGI